MDIRESIIKAVVMALQGRVDDDAINTVQDVLVIQLNGYEVQERCTAVAVQDNSAEGLMRKFIATKEVEGTAKSTLKRYREQIQHLIWFLQKPLYEVTTYDLRFYLAMRREQGHRGRKLKNSTLDGMRRCYSSFFGWLSAEGLIGRNPCAALAPIKSRKEIKRAYTAVDMDNLRMACGNARDLALVDFLYATGCRVSEVVRLDAYDIDFAQHQCKVLGKGNKERIVYLNEVAEKNLQLYLESRKRHTDALFAGRGTDRLTKEGIEAALKRLGVRAEVENVHPHRYRRTLATNMLSRGASIQDVATILGHADYKTTQVYCEINQANVQAAYRRYAA